MMSALFAVSAWIVARPAWTAEDDAAFADAVQEFGEQQALGYIGTVPDGPGKATHVRELPRDADMVILRRPIAGG